jgi:hypothetical protein
VKANNIVGVDGLVLGGAVKLGYSTPHTTGYYSTLEALVAAVNALGATWAPTLSTGDQWISTANISSRHYAEGGASGAISGYVYADEYWQAPVGHHVMVTFGTVGPIPPDTAPVGGRWTNTETMYAYNKGIDADIAPIPESPYCEITGWAYTKADGTQGVASVGACGAAPSNPKGAPPRTTPQGSGNKPGISGKDGSYCGQPFEGAIVDAVTVTWPTEVVTIPGGTFFLRSGSPAPVYPTIEGALVYDLQLKKWGKMRQRYKHLLDYSPINSTSSGIVDFAAFGILGGILTSAGKIKLFDRYPTDSYISYGKIGYYRDGNTSPEEVRVDFRELCTGYVKVETSLDGHFLASELTKTEAFTSVSSVTLYGAYPGRWANIEIGGIFDINYLEYRGFKQGRR